MNIKDYISSGILEAYVLGDLTEAERAEVERNLAQYPELQQELAAVEAVQESLLMKAAIAPPVRVRQQVLDALDAKGVHRGKEIPFTPQENTLTVWKWAVAASVSVALITSYLAFNYWNKWKTTSSELSVLIAQNKQVAQDYNQVNQRLEKLEQEVLILDDPSFTKVVMKGTPNAPEAMASVYWNAQSRQVYLRIQNMKALSQENQYQLWAIIDGKPVDAGVFDGNIAGLLKMKDIGDGVVTFAVTIEPRGGKESPTRETMQVAGNVEKG